MMSLASGGVLAGGRRWRVACSNAYARPISRGSENAGPENVTPDGNGFTITPSGGRNPPATVMLGYPAFAGVAAKLFADARIASNCACTPHPARRETAPGPLRGRRGSAACRRCRATCPAYPPLRRSPVRISSGGMYVLLNAMISVSEWTGAPGVRRQVCVEIAFLSIQQHRGAGRRSGNAHAGAELRCERGNRLHVGALRAQHVDRRVHDVGAVGGERRHTAIRAPSSAFLSRNCRVVAEAVARREARGRRRIVRDRAPQGRRAGSRRPSRSARWGRPYPGRP